MKNSLAENMLRFGVKNLNSNNKLNLLRLSEQTEVHPNTPVTIPPVKQLTPEQQRNLTLTTQQIIAIAADEENKAVMTDDARQKKENIKSITDELLIVNTAIKSNKLKHKDLKTYRARLDDLQKQLDSFRLGTTYSPKKTDDRTMDDRLDRWITLGASLLVLISTGLKISYDHEDRKKNPRTLDGQ